MKFLILNFLFVFAFGNTNADVNVLPTTSNNSILVEEELPAGVITMIDEVMIRVNTGNSSTTIDDIEVFDQAGNSVMQVSGCNLEECTVEVSSLTAGTYDVTVTVNSGSTFSGTVTLN